MRIEQRSLSRKKKGSKNFHKQVQRINLLHSKIARVRNDFQHKVSFNLIKDYDLIAVEDLKIKNMTKSSKGNQEEHGKNVSQKNGLNRSILDTAPSMFMEKLEYKAKWYGRELIKVDAKYTSQTCSNCGHKDKKNRQSQSVFKCVHCGHEENADVNAAINILGRSIPNRRKRSALAQA